MKKIPLFFAGSSNLSVLVVDNNIIGWGKPRADFFFQMWRDIPSHVIYFRNLSNTNFLQNFKLRPVEVPEQPNFRYDYLAKGEIPPGFWIQFNMGINETSGYVSHVVYKQYKPEINNLEVKKLMGHYVELEMVDFLILLTNLASSTGLDQIVDLSENNILIGDDDRERREFNDLFYNNYFQFVETEILKNGNFILEFVKLSGAHILNHLMSVNDEIKNKVSEFLLSEKEIYHLYPIFHPVILTLENTNKEIQEMRLKFENEMIKFQNETTSEFFFNLYS